VRLLAMTEESQTHMVFDESPVDEPLLYTAAYFARCRHLLVGMTSLFDQELPDLSCVLLRTLLECWLRRLWLLNNGQDDYHTLRRVAEASIERGTGAAQRASGCLKWNTRHS
jgi:hypothetical protein